MQNPTALRIAYVTPLAFHARPHGIYHHVPRALSRVPAVQLLPIGPFRRSHDPRLYMRYAWHNIAGSRRYYRQRDPIELRSVARQIDRSLDALDAHIAFSLSNMYLGYLRPEHATAFWSDTTAALMEGFYNGYSSRDTCSLSLAHTHEFELRALERCRVAFYASHWAAESAVRDYGVDPAKVRVVPRGASIKDPPTAEEAAALTERRLGGACRLLLVGVSWERKGADLAVAVARYLVERLHVRAELHVVGCKPPAGCALPSYVNLHGYLDKGVPAHAHALKRLFESSCLFLMPSRAECQGIAFCEASGYALPSIGPDVGGVSDAVRDDINGKLFPLTAFPDAAAEWIANLWGDPARYAQLCLSSYHEYETRLNWDAAAAMLVRHMREAVGVA